MNYIKDINLFENGFYNMIIEIPKGTNSKYELVEPNNNEVKEVRKVIGKYPFYYGCFPQTYAGDRDPLDAILLTKKKHAILDVVKVQPIAVIKTIDHKEVDDKIICVDAYEEISKLEKLEKKVMKFLSTYKGKNSDTIIDKNIYLLEDTLNIINSANKNYLNNKAIKDSKSIKIDF